MPLETPQPIRAEHQELHDMLLRTTSQGGRVAETARRVLRLFQPHMEKEERYAMPVLGLLAELARSGPTGAMRDALPLVDEFHAQYENLLAEHRMIAAALEEMLDAAKTEDKPDCFNAAMQILTHTHLEESVLYPAAMLAGKEIKRLRV